MLKKLPQFNVCNKDLQHVSKAKLLVYNDFQIIQKYNQIFLGLFNYYTPYKKLNRLTFISYILKCFWTKTLARSKKINMPKVFKKYTKGLKIK